MKWLDDYRMRFVLIGFVTAVVLGGGTAKADFTFGEVTNLGPTVNTGGSEAGGSLSADGLTLFFQSAGRSGAIGSWDLYMVKRETLDSDWGPALNLGPIVNSASNDMTPSISTDGLELYFRSNRYGQWDLWVTKRTTINSDWGIPVNLGPTVNSAAKDRAPSISGDGLELYFISDRLGGSGNMDIWVTKRLTTNDPWQAPVNLGPTLNTAGDDYGANITADGLTLIFSSNRPGTYGRYPDLWATTRRTTADPWREPFNLGPVINTDDVDWAIISPDGTTLFISCYERPGGSDPQDIWQAPIIPIVDFNGDMFVDSADMCIMVDNWGKDEPLCDIAPMPFGDGIVDIKDLIALAEHLPPAFLAHWEMDETEGGIACDNVGGHDGMLNGNPLWQPASGKTGGAIQLDGIDDYVSADFVWEIWKMKISASAWIKGGAPGQVIISQADGMGYGAAWLYADSSSGTLVTRLMDPQPELVSESVITDGTWHHIGLVWDGSYRYLYVDGAEVARDAAALNYTIACDGGLYFGAGKYLDAGSFFSGLIDDVRIYRKALSAEDIEALTQ